MEKHLTIKTYSTTIDDPGIWSSDGKYDGRVTSWIAYIGFGLIALKVEETLGGYFTAKVRGANITKEITDLVDEDTAKYQVIKLAKEMIESIVPQLGQLEKEAQP